MAIKSFSHKGLELYYYKGSTAKINPQHAQAIQFALDYIEGTHHPADLKAIYQHKFGEKKGSGKGVYSIEVNGNWRITFQIEDDGAVFLDYVDYHGKQIRKK